MLKLQGTVEPLGKGLHRTCYPHPEFPDRCIKVVHNFGKGGAKEIVREISYYEHLQTYLADWSGLPCYYGTVETDCGKGYIYDRIIDFDGQASRTLQATYDGRKLSDKEKEELREMLREFKQYLRDNHIVTMTLKPYNILCQRISKDKTRLVVCDNIGEASFIPVATHIKFFAHLRHERYWKRFLKQPLLVKLELF